VSREFSISDLSQEFGVTARTMRHYEEKGLLSPERRGQHRIYHGGDRVRLQLILRGKRIGFSLDEISEIIALYARPKGELMQRDFLLEKLSERKNQLLEQQICIQQMLGELNDIEHQLRTQSVPASK